MKCPFELPVRIIKLRSPFTAEVTNLRRIVASNNKILIDNIEKELADYILVTVNSHSSDQELIEELVGACEFACEPEAPFSTNQLEFANRIIKAIHDKAETVLAKAAKAKGEKE